MSEDPKTRFTSRVADYVRYRPSYPAGIIDLLRRECGLGVGARVADVGAGTGIFAARLLDSGAEVFAIEPNEAMRDEIAPHERLHPIDAAAEATRLPNGSVDLVTAAQAFHWFDRDAARMEFARILRPGGFVALIWNERSETANPFLVGYEALLQRASADYLRVRHRAISAIALNEWFGGTMRAATFSNAQRFDYEGLLGRLMSSSYAPQEGDPRYGPMVRDLRSLFEANAKDGTVDFVYETQVYYGPLGSSGKGP